MEEKPKVISQPAPDVLKPPAKTFQLHGGMVPASGVLADYRQKAWQTFNRLSLPTMTEEAWRRTDLRELPAEYRSLAIRGSLSRPCTSPR